MKTKRKLLAASLVGLLFVLLAALFLRARRTGQRAHQPPIDI
jgi:hypothetical protein